MTEKGLRFLMKQEGYEEKAYQDSAGVWTIGYGNTYWADNTPVKKGDVLSSKEEALELLKLVIPKYENSVKASLTSAVYNTLSDNQKDALTSLVYNIGGGNFQTSTVCKRVKANKDDRTIKDAFNMWNKSGGKVLKGLVKRRAEEGAMYFDEPVEIPDIPEINTSTKKTSNRIYDYTYGSNNMFYELSHSSDWVVTKFKTTPKKSNNWKSLLTGTTRPKVGDLLFAYHDSKDSGEHDHVAIYLGIHDGHINVAEGISVSGTKICENDRKVHVCKIEDSRLGYETDIITHFAHCTKKEIQQTKRKNNRTGLTGKTGDKISFDYDYKPAVGENKMKHFTLVNDRTHAYKAGESSLTWSDNGNKWGYANTPVGDERQNLVNLVNYLLDPLYEIVDQKGIGKIFVSSGYRNEEVNKVAGGSSISQHKSGQAVDIQVRQTSGSMGEALLAIAKIIFTAEDKFGLTYDQMILEKFNSDFDKENLRPVWIHISFKSKASNRTYNDSNKLLAWDSRTGKYRHLTKAEVISKPTRWDDD